MLAQFVYKHLHTFQIACRHIRSDCFSWKTISTRKNTQIKYVISKKSPMDATKLNKILLFRSNDKRKLKIQRRSSILLQFCFTNENARCGKVINTYLYKQMTYMYICIAHCPLFLTEKYDLVRRVKNFFKARDYKK